MFRITCHFLNLLLLSLAVFGFLLAFIADMAVCSMSIHWSLDEFIIFQFPFPFNAAFGLCIAFNLVALILFVILCLDSTTHLYLYIMTALIIVNYCISIGVTMKPSLQAWVDVWGKEWDSTPASTSFQMEHTCCGWQNFTDRSLSPCPFNSRSGCLPIVELWIYSRYNEMFKTLLFFCAFHIIFLAEIFYAVRFQKVNSIFGGIEIPFLHQLYLS